MAGAVYGYCSIYLFISHMLWAWYVSFSIQYMNAPNWSYLIVRTVLALYTKKLMYRLIQKTYGSHEKTSRPLFIFTVKEHQKKKNLWHFVLLIKIKNVLEHKILTDKRTLSYFVSTYLKIRCQFVIIWCF